jgi:WD40 repeat protein
VATGRELAVLTGHQNSVYSAAFSPDSLRVVTASGDKTARLWEVATGRELAVLTGHQNSVYSAAFSPDGLRVVTASGDNTARLWEVATGRELAVLTEHKPTVYWKQELAMLTLTGPRRGPRLVNSAAFSPDGLRVVTTSFDKTAQLWEVATGRKLAVLTGHQDDVYSAAFSPDGQRVVTASKDDTARLWEVATGRELAVLAWHQKYVYSAAFSPDGLRVVTASMDNTARLWLVFPNWQEMAAYAQRMLPRTQLTCEERRRFFLLGEGEECRE